MICFDSLPIAEFVAARTGVEHFGRYHCIGVKKDGILIGGVVINEYVPDVRCTITGAGEGSWLSREFLFILFDYCFNQLNCKMIINTVESDNVVSVKFTEHLGFTKEYEILGAGSKENLVILTYRKADCKWILNEKFIRKYYALRPLRDAP